MLKKIISLMLVACMLLTLGVSVSANEAEPTLYLHVTDGTAANQIFVYVAVKNNPLVVDTNENGTIDDEEKIGLAGFQLNLSYDDEKFTLVNAIKEGSYIGNITRDKASVVWGNAGGLYTEAMNPESYINEFTGITDTNLVRYIFRINTANITEEDYGKDFEFAFTETSTGSSNATLAEGGSAILDSTPAVYTVNDPRLPITGLKATAVSDLQYTGSVINPEDVVDINTIAGDVVEYKTEPAEIKNAGEYIVTATVNRTGFKPTELDPVFVTIDPKDVKINVNSASKVYGEADPEFTATVEGLVDDTFNYTVARENENVNTVGNYAIIADYELNDNYNVVENKPGTFTISQKPVTIKVADATKVYGENDPDFTVENTPELAPGDELVNLGVTYTRDSGEDVETYTITPVISNTNYKLTAQTGVLTITKKPVTVTVDAATKVYGDADPTFTSTTTDIVNGDDLGVTYTRDSGEDVGTYTITPAISNTNYELTPMTGTLTITKRTATFKAPERSVARDYPLPKLEDILAGVVIDKVMPEDKAAVTPEVKIFELDGTTEVNYDDITTADLHEYILKVVTPVAGLSEVNYKVNTIDGALHIVDKIVIDVTITPGTKVYGEEDPTIEFIAVDNEGKDHSEKIKVERVAGEDAGEYAYVISFTDDKYDELHIYNNASPDAKFVITKKPVTITAQDELQILGDGILTTYKPAVIEGLLEGDEITNIVVGFKGEYVDAVGEYAVEVKSYDDNKNYEISTLEGIYSIKAPIPVNVAFGSNKKTYGDADGAINVTVTQGNDTSDASKLVKIIRKANEDVGTYEDAYDVELIIDKDEATGIPYVLNVTGNTYVIEPKAALIKINDANKIYGDSDPVAFTAEFSGFLDGYRTEEIKFVRENGEDVGNYKIVTEYFDPNYDIEILQGTFTINKKDIEVKLIEDTLNMTYGDKVPEFKTDAPEGVLISFETIEDLSVGEYYVKVTDVESKNYNVTNKDSIVCKLIVAPRKITIVSLDLQAKEVTFAEGDIVNGDVITLDFEQLDVAVDFNNKKAAVKKFVLKDENARAKNYIVSNETFEVSVNIPDAVEEPAEGTVPEGVEATVKVIEGAKAIVLETLTVIDIPEDKPVSLDATKVDPSVETIAISNDIVKDLKDKAELAITLSEAVISFDKSALSAIANSITEAIVLKAAEYDDSLLSDKQVEAKKDLDNAKVFSFNINDGGFNFGTGKVTVTVDFENKDNEIVAAKYLKDDGTTEDVRVSYINGKANLEISHFSEYVIYTTENTNSRPSGGSGGGAVVVKPATKPDSTEDNQGSEAKPSANITLKETAKEIKFVAGYEDNTFRPDTNATRNDVVTALTALFNVTDVKNAPTFTDTEDSAVKDLAAAGVINGYEDGSFKGESDITRAEFVKLLAAALKLEAAEDAKADFSDITDHWAAEFIKTFVGKGYLLGYPDGTFRPDNKITRAEMVVVITRVVGTVDSEAATSFADLDDSHWAYSYIKNAAK